MKKILISLALLLFIAGGCSKDYLEKRPKTVLFDDQVWTTPDMVLSLLANLYNRIPVVAATYSGFETMSDNDELMWTGLFDDRNAFSTYGYGYQNYTDWGYIRDLNLFIKKGAEATELTANDRKKFIAEARFLRAYAYFEMVKRMGGMPLITETYDYSDVEENLDAVQVPRSSEAAMYDFVASELDAIKDDLGLNGTNKYRATKWTALALKSRAMLYAGSIAKYNSAMATPITTPGGEVGIPASMAQAYYAKALAASEEIITGNAFSLYKGNADKAQNFYEAIMKKTSPEVIFAKDFITGKTHNFTFEVIAKSVGEEAASGFAVSPPLGMVEAFEYTNNANGALKEKDGLGKYIVYNNMIDIFAGKDPRLFGSVMVPGSKFKGKDLDIQAGVALPATNVAGFTLVNGTKIASTYGPPDLPAGQGDGGKWVGADGPIAIQIHLANAGFGLKKFIDDASGSATRSVGNLVWWPYFRYSEILLNAAEAALESSPSQTAKALTYVNEVRSRAGIDPLTAGTLNIDRLINERRVELAFEGHRWPDIKRFRKAHVLFDGVVPTSENYALWPYRISAPSNPLLHNKYIFARLKAPRQTTFKRQFRLGNYYGQITDGMVTNNPKLVRNPNQ